MNTKNSITASQQRSELRKSVTHELLAHRKIERERRKRQRTKFASLAVNLLEKRWYIGLTIVLTIYALTADDLRTICTEKPADPYWDVLTLLALLLFIIDIILSSIGKSDYLMGNMFLLDVFSTLTMLLDFSFVDLAGIDKRNIDNFRSARTARLGVRASRVLWTIKQLRIFKQIQTRLYAEPISPEMRAASKVDPGDALPDEESEDRVESLVKESQVGKKLSELTVCRVIAVVLAMVVILPFMQTGTESQLATSAEYGSDIVSNSLKKLQEDFSESNRITYETALLRLVYSHNWFTKVSGCMDAERTCPADYYSTIFWFGLAGSSSYSQSALDLVQLREKTVVEFEQSFLKRKAFFDYGVMPAVARTELSSQWITHCDDQLVGISLLRQNIEALVTHTVKCPEDLRSRERTRYSPRLRPKASEDTGLRIVFYTDDRPYARQSSILNMIGTAFICLMLCVASMFITSDANTLILRPLESMMLKVQLIKINPLMAKELANDALRIEEVEKEKNEAGSGGRWSLQKRVSRDGNCEPRFFIPKALIAKTKQAGKKAPLETRILENTIVKLGMLLMLGFGEAGVGIISRNMSSDDQDWCDGKVEARAWVNGMIPGERMNCLIGVCRIGDFELLTEVLQCNIMAFVNSVAEIVHGVVDSFHGCPNKAMDGCFVIIWKTEGLDDNSRQKLADMSVASFVRIFAAVHSSRTLSKYRHHPGLQQKLLSHCRVNVTSGLHYGWAIEGAVGTEFKIDCSYSSTNVSLTEAVEGACEIYGVHFCLTGAVLEQCTPEMRKEARLIDRVTFDKNISVNSIIVDLYVIDMAGAAVKIEPALHRENSAVAPTSRQRFRLRQALEISKRKKWSDHVKIVKYIWRGWCMEPMRKIFTEKFIEVFRMGMQNYSAGEWSAAKRYFSESRDMLGFEDGPSAALLELMENLMSAEKKAQEERSVQKSAPKGRKSFMQAKTQAKATGVVHIDFESRGTTVDASSWSGPCEDMLEAPRAWKGFHSVDGMSKRTMTYATISKRGKQMQEKVKVMMNATKLARLMQPNAKMKLRAKKPGASATPVEDDLFAAPEPNGELPAAFATAKTGASKQKAATKNKGKIKKTATFVEPGLEPSVIGRNESSRCSLLEPGDLASPSEPIAPESNRSPQAAQGSEVEKPKVGAIRPSNRFASEPIAPESNRSPQAAQRSEVEKPKASVVLRKSKVARASPDKPAASAQPPLTSFDSGEDAASSNPSPTRGKVKKKIRKPAAAASKGPEDNSPERALPLTSYNSEVSAKEIRKSGGAASDRSTTVSLTNSTQGAPTANPRKSVTSLTSRGGGASSSDAIGAPAASSRSSTSQRSISKGSQGAAPRDPRDHIRESVSKGAPRASRTGSRG